MKLVCPACIGLTDLDFSAGDTMLRCGNCNKVSPTSSFEAYPLPALLYQLPANSAVKVKQQANGEIEVLLPAEGFDSGARFVFFLGVLAPVVAMIFFRFLFTGGRVITFPAPVVLYFPIWSSLLILGLNTALEKQIVTITKDTITVRKKRLFPSERVRFSINYIKEVRYFPYFSHTWGDRLSHFRITEPNKRHGDEGDRPSVPGISTGVDSCYFFEEASAAEQVWMIGLLNWVLRRNNFPNNNPLA
jgi:hypothetical protein